MRCNICESETILKFQTIVLKKYNVQYFQCTKCNFIQTEQPYWLDEAYDNAITDTDIGLISRNIEYSEVVAKITYNHFNPKAKFLDYGGGYGMFVRLMRDKGFDFFRQDKYCKNLFSQYFDINDLPINERKFELITAFEVFEHIENTQELLNELFYFSDTILFSTLLQPENFNEPSDWWYVAARQGQHISLFSLNSLQILAEKYKCNLYTDKHSLHILTHKTFLENPFAPSQKDSFITRKLKQLLKISVKNEKIIQNNSLLQKDVEYLNRKFD